VAGEGDEVTILVGGCQCGQVRYKAAIQPKTAHLCHCRMCQKAAGNYFMPLASALKSSFSVRGEIAYFQSSEPVRRGFCAKCGTPLIFESIGAAHLNVTLGSLDNPAAIMPVDQSGIEARMPWFDQLPSIREEVSGASETDGGARLRLIAQTSHQHPDHD
jgi:hypothetical protein